MADSMQAALWQPMITLDPHHAKRFLAESRLEKMLNEEHIENVEDLTVSWGEGIVRWNLLLVAFTLVISTVGLLPYIFIIHDHQHAPTMLPFFGNGFGFPILRVVGSALCVNVAQFLVQIRILVLLKTRLLFVTIDRLAKQADINLKDEIDPKIVRKKGEQCKFDMWNSDMASEKCIWALEKWLAASQTVASTQKGNDIPAAINDIYYVPISTALRIVSQLHSALVKSNALYQPGGRHTFNRRRIYRLLLPHPEFIGLNWSSTVAHT